MTVLALGWAVNATLVSHTVVWVPPTGNMAKVPNVMPVVVVVIAAELVSSPAALHVAVKVVKVWECLPVFWVV